MCNLPQSNGNGFFVEWNTESICKALTLNMSPKRTIQIMNTADIFLTISEGALLFIGRFLFGICQSFFSHSVAVLLFVVLTWQSLCGFP